MLIARDRVRALTQVYTEREEWCLMAEYLLKRLGIPWDSSRDTSTEPVDFEKVREIAERLGKRYDVLPAVREALHEMEQVPHNPNEC
jgi:hypothetical protein